MPPLLPPKCRLELMQEQMCLQCQLLQPGSKKTMFLWVKILYLQNRLQQQLDQLLLSPLLHFYKQHFLRQLLTHLEYRLQHLHKKKVLHQYNMFQQFPLENKMHG